LDSYSLAKAIANLTIDKKAHDVAIIELKEIASFTDYFVICSADSDTQVKAITDFVLNELRKEDIYVWHSEGYESLNWILLDFVDVVCHIFHKDTRSYYNIEKIWGDAKREEIVDIKEKQVIRKPVTRKKKNANLS
jgi:ribosome-associated protein